MCPLGGRNASRVTISIFNGRDGIACSSTLLPSESPCEFKTRMRSGVANSAICQQRTKCPENSCRHIAMLKARKGSHILDVYSLHTATRILWHHSLLWSESDRLCHCFQHHAHCLIPFYSASPPSSSYPRCCVQKQTIILLAAPPPHPAEKVQRQDRSRRASLAGPAVSRLQAKVGHVFFGGIFAFPRLRTSGVYLWLARN